MKALYSAPVRIGWNMDRILGDIQRNDGSIERRILWERERDSARIQPLGWFLLALLCLLIALAAPKLLGLFGLLGATLLVNGGRAVVSNLVSGLGGTVPKFVAWGTGAGTTGATDTTLFTESAEARTSGTVTRTNTTSSSDTVQVVGLITATAGRVITNAGLFDASTVGNLFVKSDFTSITLATGEGITFTFQISFS